MSTQSINEITQDRYRGEAEDKLLHYSDLYFYERHFKVGQGIDRDKVRHYMFIERALCEDSCELAHYIKKKIEGKLEDSPKKTKKENLQELIQKLVKEQNCNETQAVEQIMQWENVMW